MKEILSRMFGRFAKVEEIGGVTTLSVNNKKVSVISQGELHKFRNGDNEIALSQKHASLGLVATARVLSNIGVSRYHKTISKVLDKLGHSKKLIKNAVFVPVFCSKHKVVFKDANNRVLLAHGSPLKVLSRYLKLQARSNEIFMLDVDEFDVPELEIVEIDPQGYSDLQKEIESGIEELEKFLLDVDVELEEHKGETELHIEVTDENLGEEILDIIITTPFIEVNDVPVEEFNAEGLVPETYYDMVDDILLPTEIFDEVSNRTLPSKIALTYSSLGHALIETLRGQKVKAESYSKVFTVLSSTLISNGLAVEKALSNVAITKLPKLTVSNVKGLLRFVCQEEIIDEDVEVETGEYVEDEFEEVIEEVAIEEIKLDEVTEVITDMVTELVEVLELPTENIETIIDEIKDIEDVEDMGEVEEWIGVEDGEEIEIEFDDEDYEEVANRLIKSMVALGKDSKIYKSVMSRLQSMKSMRAYSGLYKSDIDGKLVYTLQEVQSIGGSEVVENVEVENDEVMEEDSVESSKKIEFIRTLNRLKRVASKKSKSYFTKDSIAVFNSSVKDSNVLLKMTKSNKDYSVKMYSNGSNGTATLNEVKSSALIDTDTKNAMLLVGSGYIADNGVVSRALSNVTMRKVARRMTAQSWNKKLNKSVKALQSAIKGAKIIEGANELDFDVKLIKQGKNVLSIPYEGKKVFLEVTKNNRDYAFKFGSDVRAITVLSKLGAENLGKVLVGSAEKPVNKKMVKSEKYDNEFISIEFSKYFDDEYNNTDIPKQINNILQNDDLQYKFIDSAEETEYQLRKISNEIKDTVEYKYNVNYDNPINNYNCKFIDNNKLECYSGDILLWTITVYINPNDYIINYEESNQRKARQSRNSRRRVKSSRKMVKSNSDLNSRINQLRQNYISSMVEEVYRGNFDLTDFTDEVIYDWIFDDLYNNNFSDSIVDDSELDEVLEALTTKDSIEKIKDGIKFYDRNWKVLQHRKVRSNIDKQIKDDEKGIETMDRRIRRGGDKYDYARRNEYDSELDKDLAKKSQSRVSQSFRKARSMYGDRSLEKYENLLNVRKKDIRDEVKGLDKSKLQELADYFEDINYRTEYIYIEALLKDRLTDDVEKELIDINKQHMKNGALTRELSDRRNELYVNKIFKSNSRRQRVFNKGER